MNSTQVISALLLTGRLITITYLFKVIRKQRRVMHSPIFPELRGLRKNLWLGSVIIAIGNLVPIIIDILGILNFGNYKTLLAYVFSNNLTAMLSAYMIWYNLRLAENIKLSGERTLKGEESEHSHLRDLLERENAILRKDKEDHEG